MPSRRRPEQERILTEHGTRLPSPQEAQEREAELAAIELKPLDYVDEVRRLLFFQDEPAELRDDPEATLAWSREHHPEALQSEDAARFQRWRGRIDVEPERRP